LALLQRSRETAAGWSKGDLLRQNTNNGLHALECGVLGTRRASRLREVGKTLQMVLLVLVLVLLVLLLEENARSVMLAVCERT
jgi:hypothetical protein